MNNETKWTPGPWEWDDSVWDYDPEEQAPWLAQKDTGHSILHGQMHCTKANARLITAAPELYDAVMALIEASVFMREEYSDMNDAVDKAERVLAKARGEQP